MRHAPESTIAFAASITALLLLTTACGKATSPSPVSPSATLSTASAPSTVDVSGRISSINASARTFQVSSTTVAVPPSASLTSAASQIEFKDLQLELQVHVHGTVDGAVVTADKVEVEDHVSPSPTTPQPDPGDQGEMEVLGSIASIDGSCPGLSMRVAGTSVKTDGATAFLKASCSQLRGGMTVEVKGTMQGGALIASRVQMDDDGGAAPEPEPTEQETEFTGTAALLGGSCPALSLSVAGRRVTSNAATEFKDGSCADVKSGVRLEVKGMAANDGSVTASRLKIDK